MNFQSFIEQFLKENLKAEHDEEDLAIQWNRAYGCRFELRHVCSQGE